MIMKRNGLMITAVLCACFSLCAQGVTYPVEINEANFPDPVFRNEVLTLESVTVSTVGKMNGDGFLSESEVAYITKLRFYNLDIKDFTGIEYLTAITELKIDNNPFTAINLSNNTKLRKVRISSCPIKSLDVSACKELVELDLRTDEQLETVNAEGCAKLEELFAYECRLSELNIKGCYGLKNLQCIGNQLTSLDLSDYTKLEQVYCDRNKITDLVVPANGGALTVLFLTRNQMSSFDVSGLKNLKTLSCEINLMTTLKVDGCPKLETLNCYNNQLTSLEVKECPALKELNCDNNKLTSLDVSKLTPLTKLFCSDNQLASLFVGELTSLTHLYCDNNQLTSLDLSACNKLGTFDCQRNKLDEEVLIFPSNNDALSNVILNNNLFGSLDMSRFVNLKHLRCNYNRLKNLVVPSTLITLYAEHNLLKSVDITVCPNLWTLNLSHNQLTALDFSKCGKISDVKLVDTNIEDLDFSGCPSLYKLDCSFSQLLHKLDVTGCTGLDTIGCESTALLALNLDGTNVKSLSFPSSGSSRRVYLSDGDNLDLSLLAKEGMDVSRIKDLRDGTLNGNILSFNGHPYISYNYDTSRGLMPCELYSINWLDGDCMPIDYTYFPDANFREVLKTKEYDKSGDGQLSKEERQAITTLDVSGCDIKDLSGIEYFPEMVKLRASGNALTSLDVSVLPKLEKLYCTSNKITELTLGNSTALNIVVCDHNDFDHIDVSGCPNLTRLECGYSNITTVDVSKNDNLEYLSVEAAKVTTLNVDNLSKLLVLCCSANQLTSLDVSNNPVLKVLTCAKNALPHLDVSKNVELETFSCENNLLKEINVTMLPNLRALMVGVNQLTSLDVSGNPLLMSLYCDECELEALDVSGNPELMTLDCSDNFIRKLDFSNNKKLSALWCCDNCIVQLDLTDISLYDGDMSLGKNSNHRDVTLSIGNRLDLTTLDADIDVSRIYNIMDATLDGSVLTLESNYVSYKYRTGVTDIGKQELSDIVVCLKADNYKDGIDDVTIDDNAPAEYYNLQGIRVDAGNLAPGIYVRRSGSGSQVIRVK